MLVSGVYIGTTGTTCSLGPAKTLGVDDRYPTIARYEPRVERHAPTYNL